MKNAMSARMINPPTTPPAIGPALDLLEADVASLLPVDSEVVARGEEVSDNDAVLFGSAVPDGKPEEDVWLLGEDREGVDEGLTGLEPEALSDEPLSPLEGLEPCVEKSLAGGEELGESFAVLEVLCGVGGLDES